jgi:hypothetical protein
MKWTQEIIPIFIPSTSVQEHVGLVSFYEEPHSFFIVNPYLLIYERVAYVQPTFLSH